MVVYALLIINKAGGLIYNRTFHAGLATLSGNDYLVLAGTFHSIHSISRNLSPTTLPRHSSGIETMQTSKFLLTCHQTPTGTKFLLFSEPTQQNADFILKKCYELYADYAMKNPFYSLEMPVRSEKFERAVQALDLDELENPVLNLRIKPFLSSQQNDRIAVDLYNIATGICALRDDSLGRQSTQQPTPAVELSSPDLKVATKVLCSM